MAGGVASRVKVTIYTQRYCQPCKLTKKKFDQLGIAYEEVGVDDTNIDYIRSLGYSQAPVIEADLGDGATVHWSGFRPTCIQQLYATLADELIASG